MAPFEDAYFLVCWHGECAESRVIQGWRTVLNYIDYQINDGTDKEYTVHSPCCELHDSDNWLLLDSLADDQDRRYHFHSAEFVYCVDLTIVRITEPIDLRV